MSGINRLSNNAPQKTLSAEKPHKLCDGNKLCLFVLSSGKKTWRIYSFDKMFSLAAISSGTFCDKHPDRHIMRIHSQIYLEVEPPFARSIP